MNIWLLLWVLLTVALIGFSIWTFSILMQQKRAWKIYSDKRKLRYASGCVMGSPDMDGAIDDHKISFFVGEHVAADARNSRKLTAIEVRLNSIMPIAGAVASGGMVPIMQGMNWKFEYVPEHESWKKDYVVNTENKDVMAAYLSDARVAALTKLMAIKNAWVILIFKDDAMLLRLDTPDPLVSAKEIDSYAKQMLAAAAVLELADGEEFLMA